MFRSILSLTILTTTITIGTTASTALSQENLSASDIDKQNATEATANLPLEDSANWQYQAMVSLSAQDLASSIDPTQASHLVDAVVSSEVLGNSRHDLSDLRLDAADGSVIPFAVRTLSARTVMEDLSSSNFNRSRTDGGAEEVTLELTGTRLAHNQIDIETSGAEFRRRVVVDGSDDGQDWKRLVQGFVLKLSGETQGLSRSSLSYPESRHRFLRIQVEPDPQVVTSANPGDRFEISSVQVSQQFTMPAVLVSTDALLSPREPTRQYGSPGSRWIIDFGAEIPVERLEVSVRDSEFVRDVSLEAESASTPGQPEFYWVYPSEGATWQRQRGEAIKDMVLTFSELRTRRLRLTIADYRNKPLTLTAVQGMAPARQIVFQPPVATMFPLKLRFGNLEAETPNYDFARNLPLDLPTTPIRAIIGPTELNPNYLAPPKPFNERYPWFIYLVLSGVSIALAAVVLNLSKAAIARHDAENCLPNPVNS